MAMIQCMWESLNLCVCKGGKKRGKKGSLNTTTPFLMCWGYNCVIDGWIAMAVFLREGGVMSEVHGGLFGYFSWADMFDWCLDSTWEFKDKHRLKEIALLVSSGFITFSILSNDQNWEDFPYVVSEGINKHAFLVIRRWITRDLIFDPLFVGAFHRRFVDAIRVSLCKPKQRESENMKKQTKWIPTYDFSTQLV